ncbi:TIGR00251 family protein [Burkholderia sp. OK233]|nr:TIGR00251 family protein [Burkholderia sp. OK233]
MPSPKSSNPTGSSFFWWDGDTLVLNVLGKPSASRDLIGKPKGTQLKVSVTAAPRAGRATYHMVRFLAAEFDVPRSSIEVVFGRMNVNKQLRIKAPQKLPSVFQDE